MATLGLKEMEKFLWEGRKKGGEREGQGQGGKKLQNILLLAVGFELPVVIKLPKQSGS